MSTNLLALWFQFGGRGYVRDGDQGTFRIIVGEPPAILPITWRPRKSANTTQRRRLLSQSRTPRHWHYVVDPDRDRELPAKCPSMAPAWFITCHRLCDTASSSAASRILQRTLIGLGRPQEVGPRRRRSRTIRTQCPEPIRKSGPSIERTGRRRRPELYEQLGIDRFQDCMPQLPEKILGMNNRASPHID